MKAIKTKGPGIPAEIQDVPIPALRDDYVLVKVKAVALNPTDWKHIVHLAPAGTTVGCDFAGVVEEVGSKVKKSWKKGDRIAGFTHGSNAVQPEGGCFAEYCIAKGDLGVKIPDNMTYEEASTLGVGITTVGQAMYQSLGLPLPGSDQVPAGVPILIYGASSATGTLAVQFAKLSGCSPIITTSSPHNFDLLRSLGADAVFDYKDPDCAKKIRDYTKDGLAHAVDCIATAETAEITSNAIGSGGGMVSYLLSPKHERKDVRAGYTVGYTVVGEYFKFRDVEYPANPADLEFGIEFWALTEKLLAEGRIRPHPVEVGKDGLKGVFAGCQAMREGRVSGKKLVYRVEETP